MTMNASSARAALRLATLLFMWVAGLFAADSAPSVWVTDFEAPAGESWAWARMGFADLAVAALSERGVATVDRDRMGALAREHDGLAMGRQQAGLLVGRWVGASLVLGGEVESLNGNDIRLTGHLTRVETAEQVASFSVTGDYVKALQPTVERWVAGLLKNAAVKASEVSETQAGKVKPEALTYFQQGVGACVASKPALAVGFFRLASGMDPLFQAAREWEAEALERGGMPRHAAALRIAVRQAGKATCAIREGQIPDGAEDPRRVLCVLDPLVVGVGQNEADVALPTATRMRSVVEDMLLADPNVRLYRADSLSGAVAETDRQLNLMFSSEAVSHYARWLICDEMIQVVEQEQPKGDVVLRVAVQDALAARPLVTLQRVVKRGDVLETLRTLVREVRSSDVLRSPEKRNALPVAIRPDELSVLPDYREMVDLLDIRMRGTADFGRRLSLAGCFAAHGRAELAAIEAEEAVPLAGTLDQHLGLAAFYTANRDADQTVSELNKAAPLAATLDQHIALADAAASAGVTGMTANAWGVALNEALATSPERERRLHQVYWWASCLLTNTTLGKAVGDAGRDKVGILRDVLIADFPNSGYAFMLRYRETSEAFQAKQWGACLTNALEASAALDDLERIRKEARAVPFFWMPRYSNEARADILFMRGVAAGHLGDRDVARQTLLQAKSIGNGCFRPGNDRERYECRGLGLASQAQGASSQRGLDQMVDKELSALERAARPAGRKVDRSRWSVSLAERVRLLSEMVYDRKYGERWVRHVIAAWNEMEPGTDADCPLYDRAAIFLEAARAANPKPDLRSLADDLARAYLRVSGADPARLNERSEREWLAPRLSRLMAFYRMADCEAAGLAWAEPFLDASHDLDMGLSLCLALACEYPDEVWVPFEFNKSARYRVIRGVVPCEPRLHVEQFERCGKNHGDQAKTKEALASFWSANAVIANYVYRNDFRRWGEAAFNIRALSAALPECRIEGLMIAMLAVSAEAADPRAEAESIRDHLVLPKQEITLLDWYYAAQAFSERGEPNLVLKAIAVYRAAATRLELNAGYKSSIERCASSVDYLEAQALVAEGKSDEAAALFRRVSHDLGTREVRFGMANGKAPSLPLGVMAAEEALKLHVPASAWAEREAEERMARDVMKWLEAAAGGDVMAKRELLVYSMDSGKKLELSADWVRTACGEEPATVEDLCLTAIARISDGKGAEARSLMERAAERNRWGRFELIRGDRNSTTSLGSGMIIPFLLARACECAGDKAAAIDALGRAMSYEREPSHIVPVGQAFERLIGQPLPIENSDPATLRHEVLKICAARGLLEAQLALGKMVLLDQLPAAEGLAAVDVGLKAHPDDKDLVEMKAQLLALNGQSEEALFYARRAVAADASRYASHYALGLALLDTGDVEGALRELHDAQQKCAKAREGLFNRKRVTAALLDALARSSTER